MAFKKITKKGEEFILDRCKRKGNRFSGSKKFSLPKSTEVSDTVYVAKPRDDKNKLISTPEDLAKSLITWFNAYSEEYQIDANIIAAQAYAESNYDIWVYSNGGAMGISQFIDVAVYETIIKNKYTFSQEIQDIQNGLLGNPNDIRHIVPNYSTRDKSIVSTPDTINIAKSNRRQLFQNIIDNPQIMIKAQCFLMNQIGQRNANLASSSLFAYNRGAGLRSTSYEDMINKTTKRFGEEYIKEGLNYVNRIFNLLAGKEPNVPVGFGYNIDFATTDLPYSNLSDKVLISGNFKLTTSQERFIQSLHPLVQDTFRQFIVTIEKNTSFNVTITSGYRTFAEQERIRFKNALYIPPRPAADPGTSYHNYGLALDISLESRTVDNLVYSFNKSKKEWIDTGVPKIAETLGLRWGGNFTDIDVVHFDLGAKYGSVIELKSIAEAQFGDNPNNIKGNQIRLA